MKYVLDTNIVALLMKGDPAAVERLRGVGREDVILPQPVVAEVEYGIQRLPKSKRKTLLAGRFELLKGQISRAAWTDDVSSAFGTIKSTLEAKGERIEDFAAAIAAHAAFDEHVLVTSNRRQMSRVPGIALEEWS